MRKPTNPWYELLDSVAAREFEAADALLRAHPRLASARNNVGETVLHFLAVENDIDGVAWLRAAGFDLNTRNDFGTPVVFEVAQLRYTELLLWFAEQGADLTVLDAEEQDLFTYLRELDQDGMVEFLSTRVPDLALQLMPASGCA
jgi:ankyrin repeat protein